VLLIRYTLDGAVDRSIHGDDLSPGSRREVDDLWLGEVNLALSRKALAELPPGAGGSSLSMSRQCTGCDWDRALDLSVGLLRTNAEEERQSSTDEGSEWKEKPARGTTVGDQPYPAHAPLTCLKRSLRPGSRGGVKDALIGS
jgi:hypothetical protein